MQRVDLYATSSGAGPALVLLHPVGLDHTLWGPLPELCARSHHVLALDHRGHGRSPAAAPGLTMADYADDVCRALDRHGIERAAVLGLSFGGMMAQEVALRHPERVSGLVLCGCPAGIPPEARSAIRERGLAAERGGMEAVLEPTIERWFTPPFRTDPAVRRVRERLLTDDVAGWSAAWHAIAGFDALPRLGGVRVPTLVVAGDQDAATPVAASKALAAAIPGARLEVLAGASHMMQFEGTDAFGRAVTGFLEALHR